MDSFNKLIMVAVEGLAKAEHFEKPFDYVKESKRRSRTHGIPPKTKIVRDQRKKPPKHKKRDLFMEIHKAEQPRECVNCGETFTPTPNKPGKINECPNCAQETTERHKAKVIWHNKHAPSIEITTPEEADRFNSKIRRHGASVNLASVVGREGASGRESSKQGTGTGLGDSYRSKFGEVHSIKR